MGILPPHYLQLEVLNSDLANSEVQLCAQRRTLILSMEFIAIGLVCPVYALGWAIKNHATELRWFHLDAIQFPTRLTVGFPRCLCNRCGVKSITALSADKNSRFTLLFEAVATDVFRAAESFRTVALRKSILVTGYAWNLKNLTRCIWQEGDALGVRAFLHSGYAWAIRSSRLYPIKWVANILNTRFVRSLAVLVPDQQWSRKNGCKSHSIRSVMQ